MSIVVVVVSLSLSLSHKHTYALSLSLSLSLSLWVVNGQSYIVLRRTTTTVSGVWSRPACLAEFLPSALVPCFLVAFITPSSNFLPNFALPILFK